MTRRVINVVWATEEHFRVALQELPASEGQKNIP
jgi:hypothetical protein